MPDPAQRSRIYVLAGVNGAGKSSIGGAMFARAGVEFFNPDKIASQLRSKDSGLTQQQANGAAWQQAVGCLNARTNSAAWPISNKNCSPPQKDEKLKFLSTTLAKRG